MEDDSAVDDNMVIKVYTPADDEKAPTRYLHITNLVRPFSVIALKELLSSTGKFGAPFPRCAAPTRDRRRAGSHSGERAARTHLPR